MGFASLQHIRNRRSTDAGHPCPLRSALRVWLPSRRVAPSYPSPVLFRTGSAPGIRPFEASAALQDIATSPPRWTHVLFLPRLMQESELSARRHGPQLLGLNPARRPRLWKHSSASPITGQLPWGSPFQGSPARALIPSGISSHVLSDAHRSDPPTYTSESRSTRAW